MPLYSGKIGMISVYLHHPKSKQGTNHHKIHNRFMPKCQITSYLHWLPPLLPNVDFMPDPRQFALFYIPRSSVKQRSLVALAFHGLQARAMSIDCLITSCLQGPEVIKQVTWDGCSYTQPDLPTCTRMPQYIWQQGTPL
mgnify:CR=1 FL=1